MATQLQIRRGSDSQVSAFTGAEGEIVVNTTNDSIHVNDGSTAGGFELARADLNNVSDTDLNAALTGNTVSALTVTTLTAGAFTSNGIDDNADATAITIDANENVGIGESSPQGKLHLKKTDTGNSPQNPAGNQLVIENGDSSGSADIQFLSASNGFNHLFFGDAADANVGVLLYDHTNNSMQFTTNAAERMRIDSSGNVGIGSSSTDGRLKVSAASGASAAGSITLYGNNGGGFGGSNVVRSKIESKTDGTAFGANMLFYTNDTSNAYQERMRIDASGNLLVGKTSSDLGATAGIELNGQYDVGYFTRSGDKPLVVNRLSSDGTIADFRKDGSPVGRIGTLDGNSIYIGNGEVNLRMIDVTDDIRPVTSAGTNRDAAVDLGDAIARFKDLYRSGSTYSTSDRNMKQDIRDLTDAERNVAVAAKGLLKAFRFIDVVAAEGDSANIHFGIIAQDLAAAFAAEGLDPNDYQVYKSATTTDEDGNEQTRLNVCYENLLAFIIAAI